MTKATRLSALTGVADPTWAPVIAGRSAWAVATSDNGNRVHLGGEFSYVNGASGTSLMATVDALTGANLPGWQNGSHAPPRGNWPLGGIVYDLGVYGNNLFVSGAEHYWEQRDATTGAAIRVNTSPHDTQRIEVIGDRVYIGCHCYRSNRALQIIEVSGTTGQQAAHAGQQPHRRRRGLGLRQGARRLPVGRRRLPPDHPARGQRRHQLGRALRPPVRLGRPACRTTSPR